MKVNMIYNNKFIKLYNNILKTNKLLPLKTAFHLAQIAKQAEEYHTFYINSFNNILTDCAEWDEQGNLIYLENHSISLLPEHAKEAENRLQELDHLEVDLPDVKLPLGDFEKVSLSPEDIQILFPFLSI